MSSFISFALPDIGPEEEAEVLSCLQSSWLTTGPKTKLFEENFSQFLGGDLFALAVNSATAGLHLGLEALGIGPGDEVITTTHTFTATAEVIRYLGAHPVLVDIDPQTLCIDLNGIKNAITNSTKAIIPVHFGGRSAEMGQLLELAKNNNLYVMEDAAHALPSTYDGKLIGCLESDVTVFSFYANKTITTGEGGMVVTRNPKIAERIRTMRLHGINRDAFDRFTSKVPSWFYEVVAPGFKYNMTDIAASIGIHQLKKAFSFQLKRQAIAEKYDAAFLNLSLKLPPKSKPGDVHSWHLYVIQLEDDASVNRDEFIEEMFRSGVGCSVHYIPLHLHPYWRDAYKLTPKMFPVSQKVYERCVSLPIYSKMSDDDVNKVIATVKNILSR